MRCQAESAEAETPPAIVPVPRRGPAEATRRWAALLQQVFEVETPRVPHLPRREASHRITQASVIGQILAHPRARAATAAHAVARTPPSTQEPSGPGATRRPAAAYPHQAHHAR